MSATLRRCAACGRLWPARLDACPDDGALLVPRSVGPYRLELRLGEGALGEVFRAVDERDAAVVALKLFFDRASPLPALPPADFAHPHLAPARAAGRADDGRSFVVSEFAPGDSLRFYLDAHVLDDAHAAVLGAQLASALAYAHERGQLHGDVKPDNVVVERVDDRPHARLVDSANASAVDGARHDPAGQALAGTPRYMSPELVRAGARSAASDVYALGCTVFELVAGRTPFDAESMADVLRGHLEDAPPALPSRAVGQPHALAEIVAACLHKDPAARPTAQVVAASLAAVCARAVAPLLPALPPRPRALAPKEGSELLALLAPVLAGGALAASEPDAPTPAVQHALARDPAPRAREIATALAAGELARAQLTDTLAQAARAARELDRCVRDGADPTYVRALLRALALAHEQLELWLAATPAPNR